MRAQSWLILMACCLACTPQDPDRPGTGPHWTPSTSTPTEPADPREPGDGSHDVVSGALERLPWVPRLPGPGGGTGEPEAGPEEVWIEETVMAKLQDGVTAEELADALGVEVSAPSESGYVGISVPVGSTQNGFLAELQEHPMVGGVSRMSYVSGAGRPVETDVRANPGQWHLAFARAPLAGTSPVEDWVVAVLDTGVAYEARKGHAQAPSLAGPPIVAPYDFVHDDDHAGDDHQHGTHIASLIASTGEFEGVAAGVGLMPIKVLDETNRGTELALIDGISHAIRNGADVMNLSLSFPVGYVPTPALQEVLQEAHDAGIVMVAAAGNSGVAQVTWPAASRLVIAVGAVRPAQEKSRKGTWDHSSDDLAPYSNHSSAIDILAPGGDLAFDRTGDGLPDGMLAETIHPGDPSRIAPWLYAGTSQAAAVVSGAVVHLLQQGADADDIPHLLHRGAIATGLPGNPWAKGIGPGALDIESSMAWVQQLDDNDVDRQVTAGVMPFLRQTVHGTLPTARVWPVVSDDDDDGKKKGTRTISVHGSLVTPQASRSVWCEVPAGQTWCDLQGSVLSSAHDTAAFGVQLVLVDDTAYRPTPAMFATEAAEALLGAIDADAEFSGAMPAFHFLAGPDPMLGDLAESYVVHNAGTGLLSSPLGIVMRPGALRTPPRPVSVDLDGSGLLSSPLGAVPAQTVDLGGGSLVSFDGTDLWSGALGLHPTHLFGSQGPAGSGLLSSPLGFTGDPIDLGDASSDADLSGTHLGGWVSRGGFRLGSGEEAGNHLIGSGAVSLRAGLIEGSGAGSQSGTP